MLRCSNHSDWLCYPSKLRPCNHIIPGSKFVLHSTSSSRSVIPNRMLKVCLLWSRPHQNISKRVVSASVCHKIAPSSLRWVRLVRNMPCATPATWTKGFTSSADVYKVLLLLYLRSNVSKSLLHLFVYRSMHPFLSYLTSFLVCNPIQAIQLIWSKPNYS